MGTFPEQATTQRQPRGAARWTAGALQRRHLYVWVLMLACVLVAGDPESCLQAISLHEAVGVDELQFLMATETIPHDKVMSSIEMFGKYVIPEVKKQAAKK